MSPQDVLPFPPTPSASIAGRKMQESVYTQRKIPSFPAIGVIAAHSESCSPRAVDLMSARRTDAPTSPQAHSGTGAPLPLLDPLDVGEPGVFTARYEEPGSDAWRLRPSRS